MPVASTFRRVAGCRDAAPGGLPGCQWLEPSTVQYFADSPGGMSAKGTTRPACVIIQISGISSLSSVFQSAYVMFFLSGDILRHTSTYFFPLRYKFARICRSTLDNFWQKISWLKKSTQKYSEVPPRAATVFWGELFREIRISFSNKSL